MDNKAAIEKEEEKYKCSKYLEKMLQDNKKIHKLMDSITDMGCKIPSDFFLCRSCDASISGGFSVPLDKEGHDKFMPQVHAYDQCRAQIEWNSCLQHACAEVRASALSGECGFMQEVYRGKMQTKGGYSDCVKRRAGKSIAHNPACGENSAAFVEQAFHKCFNDRAPFE